ncbi:hypothetical protein [Thiocapsa imhoffii]|uniref:hypothetical protein n=1 Tax=Thiocapsa imhoffii TaxID=382777 RepID=UPI00190727C2|nr:hypothetical protein [Thiocapsa imhoffii]
MNTLTLRVEQLPGARTESVDIAWADCAKLVGSEPDWVFWHRWPDHRLHDHDDPGQDSRRSRTAD